MAMYKKSIVRLNRRALLSGIAVITAAAAVNPKAKTVFDRIIMRDGWILKESDIL